MKINTYAVNCNDAWLNTEGDDISGSYVKYKDHQEVVASLEAKCSALTAENAALKAICEDRRTFIMNGVQLGYIQVPTVETDPALETIRVAVSPQEPTPATDAFLAEVRASEAKHVYDSILDNPAVTDMESLVDWLEQYANDSASFAAQLRQGAAL